MKVVKIGKIPAPPVPWWVGEIIECANCHTQIELEEGDKVKIASQERRPGGKAVLTYEHCPTCGLVITKTYHQTPR